MKFHQRLEGKDLAKIVGFLILIGALVILATIVWLRGGSQVDAPLWVTQASSWQSLSETSREDTQSQEEQSAQSTETSVSMNKIYVDLKGAVQHPGVYALPVGSRVFDLIEMAGGLSEDAAEMVLNQAQLLQDQQLLYVPNQTEWEEERLQVGTALKGVVNTDRPSSQLDSSSIDKVNINQADLSQLQTLPGIGAKKAQAILDYRSQHGSFQSIEDLRQIKGIGPKLLEKLKDRVTLQ